MMSTLAAYRINWPLSLFGAIVFFLVQWETCPSALHPLRATWLGGERLSDSDVCERMHEEKRSIACRCFTSVNGHSECLIQPNHPREILHVNKKVVRAKVRLIRVERWNGIEPLPSYGELFTYGLCAFLPCTNSPIYVEIHHLLFFFLYEVLFSASSRSHFQPFWWQEKGTGREHDVTRAHCPQNLANSQQRSTSFCVTFLLPLTLCQ